MPKPGKKYLESVKKVDKAKRYDFEEAVKTSKEASFANLTKLSMWLYDSE
jgi:ribosomal protein L1